MREILADLGTVLVWILMALVVILIVVVGLVLWHGYADLGAWTHLF